MSNNYFAFKKFVIYQDHCAMKVGTDGVLLGAWVHVDDALRILDAGAGTGLIAIMCAQRSQASIDAVEIDENAYLQARDNAKACVWSDRISVIHDSFQHFTSNTSNKYNVVVSNPPYFRNSLKPPNRSRSAARHNELLSYESLIYGSSITLDKAGKLAVILPADDITEFTGIAWSYGLYPKRQTFVRPRSGKNYSRCMTEYTMNPGNICEVSELSIREQHVKDYTAEYVNLTGDYYLTY